MQNLNPAYTATKRAIIKQTAVAVSQSGNLDSRTTHNRRRELHLRPRPNEIKKKSDAEWRKCAPPSRARVLCGRQVQWQQRGARTHTYGSLKRPLAISRGSIANFLVSSRARPGPSRSPPPCARSRPDSTWGNFHCLGQRQHRGSTMQAGKRRRGDARAKLPGEEKKRRVDARACFRFAPKERGVCARARVDRRLLSISGYCGTFRRFDVRAANMHAHRSFENFFNLVGVPRGKCEFRGSFFYFEQKSFERFL